MASSGDYDWAVTALFYAALHGVQAYLAEAGVVLKTHSERDRYLTASSDLAEIAQQYRQLRARIENARYDLRRFGQSEFEAIEVSLYRPIFDRLADLAPGTERPQQDSEPEQDLPGETL